MATNWSLLDEGVWRGIQIRLRAESGEAFPDLGTRPELSPGEPLYMELPGRVYRVNYTPATNRPYTRLRVRGASDPLMAPFWFLLVLPINLLLWAIASSRGRERVREQSFGDALLRITDQGVKVYWQKHWETYGQYSLSFEPGVGVTPAFREHAAQFGRTLPEHVAYRLSKALDAYGSYGSGGPEGPDNYQRTH